jgi:hypothetical protein
MKRLSAFVLIAIIGLCALRTGDTRAQEGVSVSGILEDQTGAVITGGKLTLVNRATAETSKTLSDQSGHFTLSNVAPGEYILKAVADGFESAQLEITVGTKPLKPIKVKLEISISEEVTVNSAEPESRL